MNTLLFLISCNRVDNRLSLAPFTYLSCYLNICTLLYGILEPWLVETEHSWNLPYLWVCGHKEDGVKRSASGFWHTSRDFWVHAWTDMCSSMINSLALYLVREGTDSVLWHLDPGSSKSPTTGKYLTNSSMVNKSSCYWIDTQLWNEQSVVFVDWQWKLYIPLINNWHIDLTTDVLLLQFHC